MKPISIICNQCGSEEFIFHIAGKVLTFICEHCPTKYEVRLTEHNPEQMKLFEMEN
mgnify:CR=1 FL=1